jgi:hypothetical protein
VTGEEVPDEYRDLEKARSSPAPSEVKGPAAGARDPAARAVARLTAPGLCCEMGSCPSWERVPPEARPRAASLRRGPARELGPAGNRRRGRVASRVGLRARDGAAAARLWEFVARETA